MTKPAFHTWENMTHTFVRSRVVPIGRDGSPRASEIVLATDEHIASYFGDSGKFYAVIESEPQPLFLSESAKTESP